MHVLFKCEFLLSINSSKHCPDGTKLIIVLSAIIFLCSVDIFKVTEQLLWRRDTCESGNPAKGVLPSKICKKLFFFVILTIQGNVEAEKTPQRRICEHLCE